MIKKILDGIRTRLTEKQGTEFYGSVNFEVNFMAGTIKTVNIVVKETKRLGRK